MSGAVRKAVGEIWQNDYECPWPHLQQASGEGTADAPIGGCRRADKESHLINPRRMSEFDLTGPVPFVQPPVELAAGARESQVQQVVVSNLTSAGGLRFPWGSCPPVQREGKARI